MTSQEILKKFIDFYAQKGHKQIPNVSLVPEGDSTLLFVNSGMFPLVPYLSGQPHPLGKRLVNVQRSLRFEDIDEIGDPRHTLAFHMVGNWSLADYFKSEQLPWAYEFLVEVLGLDPNRLYATVFEGDEFAPRDTESVTLLKKIFTKYGVQAEEGDRIFACPRKSNWWQRGDAVGELGGPDSEVYYYLGDPTKQKKGVNPTADEENYLEIGNSVFMQYKKTEKGWEEMPQKNVDFGGGLERIAQAVQNKKDIFETDNFWPIIEEIQEVTRKSYTGEGADKADKLYMRILADHLRAAYLLAMDGVVPSNKDQGYVLRRILRKMFRTAKHLGVDYGLTEKLVSSVKEIGVFQELYAESIESKETAVRSLFADEEKKFAALLKTGEKEATRCITRELTKSVALDTLATKAFDLYQSLGYPVEIFYEDLKDNGISVQYSKLHDEFMKKFSAHQALSRSGAEQKFKGGLADQSDTVVKYHTVTHLLQAGLRKVLGEHVRQLGSNITGERLRFDFPHPDKLSDEEVGEVEKFVNTAVLQGLPVNRVVMPKAEAEKSGALFIKGESYPESVSVYFVGAALESALSKEFCGGPHVANTSELSPIKIYKQEKIGEGKMRIYAKFV